MLADRQFITETGKLTTERRKSGIGKYDFSKKKQVVETTCGSHEKTS
jgi:hypothetical protein